MISQPFFKCSMNNSVTPEWSSLVPRWNQLDIMSYGLSELLWENKESLTGFKEILFSRSRDCFFNDKDFVTHLSPTKFIFTLPCVPGFIFCKILNFDGPVHYWSEFNLNFPKAIKKFRSLNKEVLFIQADEFEDKIQFKLGSLDEFKNSDKRESITGGPCG